MLCAIEKILKGILVLSCADPFDFNGQLGDSNVDRTAVYIRIVFVPLDFPPHSVSVCICLLQLGVILVPSFPIQAVLHSSAGGSTRSYEYLLKTVISQIQRLRGSHFWGHFCDFKDIGNEVNSITVLMAFRIHSQCPNIDRVLASIFARFAFQIAGHSIAILEAVNRIGKNRIVLFPVDLGRLLSSDSQLSGNNHNLDFL